MALNPIRQTLKWVRRYKDKRYGLTAGGCGGSVGVGPTGEGAIHVE